MTEQAGTGATGRYYCRGCGSQVRLGARSCTECGLTAGPGHTARASLYPATGQVATSVSQPRPDKRHIRLIAVGAGVLVVTGLPRSPSPHCSRRAQAWNSLAQSYGLNTYSQGDL